jgi:ABC-2 type transport system ATP-binding protein
MSAMIQAESLTRRFGDHVAVDGLTFRVEEGEVFGVLGPNGAGKTTTVRMLNGVLAPTSGQARVLGLDPCTQGDEIRRRTGVLTETPSLYERLTARENLALFATLYEVPEHEAATRVEELLRFLGLGERADDKAGGFSKGLKQRLALARALIHAPQLLFLDEPTSGLDPEAARQVTSLIEKLSHIDGRTVLLCTHNLDDAQRLCGRVAVVNRGRLLACGTLRELTQSLWQSLWVDLEFVQPADQEAWDAVDCIPGVMEMQQDETRMAVQLESEERVPELVASLVQAGAQVLRVSLREHSLEEVYFALQDQAQCEDDAA